MDVSFRECGEEWIEIPVDSAAEESACPRDWGKQFGMGEKPKDEFGKCQRR